MRTSIPSFFSQASAKGARSTALHALQWVIGLLLAALPAVLIAGAPTWIPIALLGAIGVVLLVFLAAYVYLLFQNPDALRSEEFSLSKMAMEKGLVGDTTSGFVDARTLSSSQNANALTISADQGEGQ